MNACSIPCRTIQYRPGIQGRQATLTGDKRKSALILAAIVLVGTGTGIWAWRRKHYPAHNFSVVRPGVLLRSGQPSESGWRVIHRKHRIKTVIDLRADLPDAEWAIAERRFCQDNGIRYVKMVVGLVPTDEQIQRLIAIVTDPNNQPVLIHCEAGSRRTGVMVGAYRILVEGWDQHRALADYRRFNRKVYPAHAEFLKGLCTERRSPTGRPEAPGE